MAKLGRPSLPPERRKRNNVGIRMRDKLRADLQNAGAANGRSLSEEIETRLERSFWSDDLDALQCRIKNLEDVVMQISGTTGEQLVNGASVVDDA